MIESLMMQVVASRDSMPSIQKKLLDGVNYNNIKMTTFFANLKADDNNQIKLLHLGDAVQLKFIALTELDLTNYNFRLYNEQSGYEKEFYCRKENKYYVLEIIEKSGDLLNLLNEHARYGETFIICDKDIQNISFYANYFLIHLNFREFAYKYPLFLRGKNNNSSFCEIVVDEKCVVYDSDTKCYRFKLLLDSPGQYVKVKRKDGFKITGGSVKILCDGRCTDRFGNINYDVAQIMNTEFFGTSDSNETMFPLNYTNALSTAIGLQIEYVGIHLDKNDYDFTVGYVQ